MARRTSTRTDPAPGGEPAAAEIRIGGRLRHSRLMKGMSLKEVGAAVGVSESFVSKLENDKVQPSLAVLHRLVSVLGINVSAMFSGGSDESGPLFVMRAGQGPTLTTRLRQTMDGVVLERLIPQTRNALLQVNIHSVEPGGGSHGLISHVGEEMGYVLAGALDLTVGEQLCRLGEGDTFYFPSEEPHGYTNPGDTVARILWVNTPPTF
jgi:transcriptional regulator with XRE-family HTH domain